MNKQDNFLNKDKLDMNLQFFAKDDGGDGGQGEDGGNGDDGGDDDPGEGGGEDKLPQSQSELDAIINKSNQAAIDNVKKDMYSKEDIENLLDEKMSEVEKLKNMSDDEKEEYEKDQLKEKIAEYERKETIREMSKTAQETLEEKGIAEFEEFIPYIVTEEAESTKERVNKFAEAMEKRDKEIEEKIKKETQEQLGVRTILDGNNASTKSIGQQYAEQANEQNKQPDNDPWKQQ